MKPPAASFALRFCSAPPSPQAKAVSAQTGRRRRPPRYLSSNLGLREEQIAQLRGLATYPRGSSS